MRNKGILVGFALAFLISCSPQLVHRHRPQYQVGRIDYNVQDGPAVEWYANYVNIETSCGVLSVTVNHVSPYLDAQPLAQDEKNDIVVYKRFGTSPAYRIADRLPLIGDSLVIAGQFYKQDVEYQGYVAGILEVDGVQYIAVVTPSYGGMSGSPVFDTNDHYVGSVSGLYISGRIWRVIQRGNIHHPYGPDQSNYR